MATTNHRIRGANRTRHGKLEQLLIRRSAILRDRRAHRAMSADTDREFAAQVRRLSSKGKRSLRKRGAD